jgi:hypothetical protein
MLRVGVSIAGFALLTSGCAFWQAVVAPLPSVEPSSRTLTSANPLPAKLSEAATAALEKARLHVADAKRSRTLWKSAAEKLAEAELAATSRDSASTLRLSHEIVVLCEQSRAQLLHPPVVW